MSRTKGLIKMQHIFNRSQQQADWRLLKLKIGKQFNEPDWDLSVKKIDKYMESVCKESGIDFNKEICGRG